MIPGKCRIWARKLTGEDTWWFEMNYGARCYADCESLIEYYQGIWGELYEYMILSACDNRYRTY